jgi:Zn-dependent M28 family amino/carboxypeptidase
MSTPRSRLYNDVAFLTSVDPPRNWTHPESLNKVAVYIESELKTCGLPVEIQEFTAKGTVYKNILASYGPSDAPRLVLGAHYDVYGEMPGADDNASAVAGLLETARMLASEKPSLAYRVDFVAYCLEEPPFFATGLMGSAVHARSLKARGIEVLAMLCYEMIGYFSDEPYSQQFPHPSLAQLYPHQGNFIVVVGIAGQEDLIEKVKDLMQANSGIEVYSIAFPGKDGLAGLSDQRSYWEQGYPAVMINNSSFLRNPNYHTPNDTIDTLDFARMEEVVKGAYAAIKYFL